MDSLKLIFEIIGKKQKNKFFLILFLIIFAMLLETLSIGAIIPFLSLATSQTLDPNIEKFIGLIKSIFKLNTSTILILFLFLIFLLKNIYLIFIHKIQSKFTETIKLELSRKLFNKYLNEDYTFYLNRNTSILFRNITTEIGSFVEFLTSVLTLFA